MSNATTQPEWKRRAEFVNTILAMAITAGDLTHDEVDLDGIAGDQFDSAIRLAAIDEDQRKDYLWLAIELEAPVEGLENDGKFGEKWTEVLALCEEVQPEETSESNGSKSKVVYDGGH